MKVPISGVVFLKNEEPSLQWVLDGFGIAVNVGDDDPATLTLHSKREFAASPRLGPDEIVSPLFVKAGDGPVRTVTLASWAYEAFNPVSSFGWYFPTKNVMTVPQITYLFNITNTPLSNAKTMIPPVVGATSFDPDAINAGKSIAFGISVTYPFFRRDLFSEDFRNTFRNALPHHIRVYGFSQFLKFCWSDVQAFLSAIHCISTPPLERSSGFRMSSFLPPKTSPIPSTLTTKLLLFSISSRLIALRSQQALSCRCLRPQSSQISVFARLFPSLCQLPLLKTFLCHQSALLTNSVPRQLLLAAFPPAMLQRYFILLSSSTSLP